MQNSVLETQNSAERIKQLVEREGKAARNLVTWSVPVADAASKEARGGNAQRHDDRPPVATGSRHSNSRFSERRRDKKGKLKGRSSAQNFPPLAAKVSRVTVSDVGSSHDVDLHTSLSEREEICKYYSSKTQRQSRSSKSPSRLNLHARYWSYLFDNLHRAVDEIYKTCEVDESTVECQVCYSVLVSVFHWFYFFLQKAFQILFC